MARHMRARKLPFMFLYLLAGAMVIVGLIGGVMTLSSLSSSTGVPVISTDSTVATPPSTNSAVPPIAVPGAGSESKLPVPKKTAVTTTPSVKIAPAPPLHLEIPSAHISYPIAELPLESRTEETATSVKIDPPENPNEVYWLSAGGMPGQKVATYITAHSSSDGSRWPLNNISNEKLVKIGSPVRVKTANGALTYKVTELFSLPRVDFAKTKYAYPPAADMLVITSCYTYDLYQQTRVLIATRVK